MIDNETGFAAVGFFNIFLFCVINFRFILSSCFGIICSEFCRFFKSPVRQCVTAGFYNDVRTGKAFCMEPPVIAGGKAESQFVVLKVIFSNVNVVSVAAEVMEGTAGDFCFFIAVFPADIAVFYQLFRFYVVKSLISIFILTY